MHVIIEHMFLMTNRCDHYMHVGTRISCDHGKSWVIECKRKGGLRFTKAMVTSFESRRREVDWDEYRIRRHHNLNYGMVT